MFVNSQTWTAITVPHLTPYLPKKALMFVWSHSGIPIPGPTQLPISFCLCVFTFSGLFILKASHNMWPFASGLHLA